MATETLPKRKSGVTRLSQISPVHDLSAVLLHRESFTEFEDDVVRSYEYCLSRDRMPGHWAEDDWPDKRSIDYVCSVFKEKLPTIEELSSNIKMYGNDIALVGGGCCINDTALGATIDEHKVVLRMNHPYIDDHVVDIGDKTTIHMMNERRCYEFTRKNSRDDFHPLGLVNVFAGTTSELAACLEYARYLDCGGTGGNFVMLKPSFRKGIDLLHANAKPSLGFISVAVALRIFDVITLYAYDLGEGTRHYHGRDRLHPSHDPEGEANAFKECEGSLNNFTIVR